MVNEQRLIKELVKEKQKGKDEVKVEKEEAGINKEISQKKGVNFVFGTKIVDNGKVLIVGIEEHKL
jgi:hypothetical protein